jgi:hypothetical protein
MPTTPTAFTTASWLTSVSARVPPNATSKPPSVGGPTPPIAVTVAVAPAGQPAMPSMAVWMSAAV